MINLEWVKDYIDISDQDLETLAVKITESGINIEKVITNKIDNLVIGKVVSCIDQVDRYDDTYFVGKRCRCQ